jgi:hypothetical protein
VIYTVSASAIPAREVTPGRIRIRCHVGNWSDSMVFTKRLRDGVRCGRIRCSVRIWMRLQVKVGGRYSMEEGHIVVDSIEQIPLCGITPELSRESGFSSVRDLLETARHGRGRTVYLIRFHYLPPGAWDVTAVGDSHGRFANERGETGGRSNLLRRIRASKPPGR